MKQLNTSEINHLLDMCVFKLNFEDLPETGSSDP